MSECLVIHLVGPLRIPLQLQESGLFQHARPPSEYTRFPSPEAAEQAIVWAIGLFNRSETATLNELTFKREDFQIAAVLLWESERDDRDRILTRKKQR